MELENLASNKVAGGWHKQYSHRSNTVNCSMRFAIFLPPQVNGSSLEPGKSLEQASRRVPVMYWLSGLTCTDENFMQKAGAFKLAAELGIAIVAPDTSPRGDGVADDESGAYDLGLGAGFYVNATQAPWQQHYQMYDYIVNELPELIEANFPVNQQRVISGHSMGGHGALTIALRNPQRYQSVTAFAPISHPMNCPWGQKAFTAYLGGDQTNWQQYDASVLLAKAAEQTQQVPALVSQGDADSFLVEQLKPESLVAAAEKNGYPLTVEMCAGYDHSYYFISSFIEQHLRFHAEHLTEV